MIIDFSKITVYEILALTLSLIAILVPFIKWAWHSWIIKANLNFIPNEKMFIFFNRSGAYVRIDGAYEALNKITKIALLEFYTIVSEDSISSLYIRKPFELFKMYRVLFEKTSDITENIRYKDDVYKTVIKDSRHLNTDEKTSVTRQMQNAAIGEYKGKLPLEKLKYIKYSLHQDSTSHHLNNPQISSCLLG